MDRQTKWDLRFLRLAREYSTYSKDPSTKVGAIIAKDVNDVIAHGFNGFPKGDNDLPEEYADRKIKLQKIDHAEHNAFKKAMENGYRSLTGCTFYTYPFPPCIDCAKKYIVDMGIKRVVAVKPSDEQEKRWGDSFREAEELYKKHGIGFVLYDIGELE